MPKYTIHNPKPTEVKFELPATIGTPTTEDVESTLVDTVVEDVLNHTALGIYKDVQTNVWMVVEVLFNPVTGNAKVVSETPSGPDKYDARERFNIMTVNKIESF